MRLSWVIVLLVVSVGLVMPHDSRSDSEAKPELVPIGRLVATPSTYDSQIVATIGFLVFQEREEVLYASREDAVHAILPNGLELELSGSPVERSRLSALNGKYVLIVGRFRAPLRNTQRLTSGAIVQVVEVQDESSWGRDEGVPFVD